MVPEEVAARRDGAEGQRQRGHGERPDGRLQAPEYDGGYGRAGAREDVCLGRRLVEDGDGQRRQRLIKAPQPMQYFVQRRAHHQTN